MSGTQAYLDYKPKERYKSIVERLQYNVSSFLHWMDVVAEGLKGRGDLASQDIAEISERNALARTSKQLLSVFMITGHHTEVPSYATEKTIEEYHDNCIWYAITGRINELLAADEVSRVEVQLAYEIRNMIDELIATH